MPSLIVLHYTAMTSADAACEVLCDPQAEVSAHYLIDRRGGVTQLVDEAKRAWHAGAGSWRGLDDVNSSSIGIELCNDGYAPFSAALMDALEILLSGIMARWSIPSHGVIGHSDCAPGRKIDPGRKFDWLRLEKQGLVNRRGHDDGPTDAPSGLFRTVAREAGYTADVDDDALLAAVRLRYRPGAIGPLAAEDFVPLGHTALWT